MGTFCEEKVKEKDQSFNLNKEKLNIAPFLALLDFDQAFELETNASMIRIEIVLSQNGR